MRYPLAVAVLILSVLPGATFAQEPGKADVTPLLLPGLSNHHHSISTKNPEAQKYFDQGLNLVFGFNRYEAVRSFRRAAQLDSTSAMPYWGMALAYGRHMNMDWDMDVDDAKASAAIQQALGLAGNASEEEQLYIRALAERCSQGKKVDEHVLDENYAAAMTKLVARYPDDLDAWAFSLEARMMAHRYEWFQGSMPQHGTGEIIQEIEDLLRRDPDHPLANHLHVHILDTGHPELALGSAYRLSQVAPGLGHLVHMGTHIFFNLGEFDLVARFNEQAAAAEREYMRLAHPEPNVYTLVYYMHDLHMAARARAEQGLFTEAQHSADGIANYIAPMQDQWPMFADYYLPVPLLVLVRFQKWDEVLNLPEPQLNRQVTDGLWHYGRALAFAAKGQRQKAQAEKTAIDAVRRQIPADAMWMLNTQQGYLSLASLIVDARLEEDPKKAIELWKKAVKAQDALAYDEPPPWYYPIRESLGAALLRAGNAGEAEPVFRDCLRQNPHDARALFGLMEALKAQKKADAAAWVQHEFEAAWKNADLALRIEDL